MRSSLWSLLILLLEVCSIEAIPQQPYRSWTSTAGYVPDYILVGTAENTTINCISRYSVLLNGTTPGPSLYLKENHTTWIRVYNNIADQNLTVHWHGLSERLDIFSDGTPQVSQWPIASGEYFDYAISPIIGDAGSYFYHSHVGFQAVTATGPLIVTEADNNPPYEYNGDVILFLQDFYNKNDSVIEQGLVADPFVWSGEPEAIMINGKSGNSSFSNATDDTCTPEVIYLRPDVTYRMRFICNTAISFVTMGIEDHDNLTIIEADAGYTKPWSTDHIQIASGQRFSILFHTKTADEIKALNKTQFWLRYENRDRPTNVSGYALLQYEIEGEQTSALPTGDLPESSPVKLSSNQSDITSWAEYVLTPLTEAVASTFPPLSEVTRTIYITARQVIRTGFYNGSFHGTLQWAQNDLVYQTESSQANHSIPYLVQVYTTGQVPNYTAAIHNEGWDPLDNNHAFPALVGETLDIIWLSNNGPTGGWDFHPFHAHGAHYWDIGSGNGTYNATANHEKYFSNGFVPAKRDTTLLHRYATSGVPETTAGWRGWRIKVTEDDVGAWLMHCHILAHMTMGMMTAWVFGTAEEIMQRFPKEPFVSGYLTYGGDAYGNSSYDPFVAGYTGSNKWR